MNSWPDTGPKVKPPKAAPKESPREQREAQSTFEFVRPGGFALPELSMLAKPKPRAAQYTNDIQTKMWLISAGFGIAPTTATLAEVKRPGLIFRALPPGVPRVQTVLVWRRDDHSPVLSHFRDCFPPLRNPIAPVAARVNPKES